MLEQYTLVDLFCGMGGWSVGFHREGFRCIGVDLVDVGYPYEFVQADIQLFNPDDEPIEKPDVVTASTPCTEFSQLTKLSAYKKQRPEPDPKKGMILVKEAYRVIKKLKPKFWMLENVRGSIPYITEFLGQPPQWNVKPWYIWGKLPPFLVDIPKADKGTHAEKLPNGKWLITKGGDRVGLPEDFPFDPLRSWRRARMPLPVSLTMARACRQALAGNIFSPSPDPLVSTPVTLEKNVITRQGLA